MCNETVPVRNLILNFKKKGVLNLFSIYEVDNILKAVKETTIKTTQKISVKSHIICINKNKTNLKFYFILNNENVTKRKNGLIHFLDDIKNQFNLEIIGQTCNKTHLFIDLKDNLENEYEVLTIRDFGSLQNIDEFQNPK